MEYVFEGYNGITFYSYIVFEEVSKSFGQGSEFVGDVSGAEIYVPSGIKYGTNGDNENFDITMEGKIFLTAECIVYCYPVYQEADGDVYIAPYTTGQHIGGLGAGSHKDTWEKDDVGATTVEISYEIKGLTDKVDILYMNSNDEIIKKNTYEPGQIPEKIEVPGETELIIVKNKGQEEMQVDVYTKEDTIMQTFVSTGTIVLRNETTELIWND